MSEAPLRWLDGAYSLDVNRREQVLEHSCHELELFVFATETA